MVERLTLKGKARRIGKNRNDAFLMFCQNRVCKKLVKDIIWHGPNTRNNRKLAW